MTLIFQEITTKNMTSTLIRTNDVQIIVKAGITDELIPVIVDTKIAIDFITDGEIIAVERITDHKAFVYQKTDQELVLVYNEHNLLRDVKDKLKQRGFTDDELISKVQKCCEQKIKSRF